MKSWGDDDRDVLVSTHRDCVRSLMVLELVSRAEEDFPGQDQGKRGGELPGKGHRGVAEGAGESKVNEGEDRVHREATKINIPCSSVNAPACLSASYGSSTGGSRNGRTRTRWSSSARSSCGTTKALNKEEQSPVCGAVQSLWHCHATCTSDRSFHPRAQFVRHASALATTMATRSSDRFFNKVTSTDSPPFLRRVSSLNLTVFTVCGEPKLFALMLLTPGPPKKILSLIRTVLPTAVICSVIFVLSDVSIWSS